MKLTLYDDQKEVALEPGENFYIFANIRPKVDESSDLLEGILGGKEQQTTHINASDPRLLPLKQCVILHGIMAAEALVKTQERILGQSGPS